MFLRSSRLESFQLTSICEEAPITTASEITHFLSCVCWLYLFKSPFRQNLAPIVKIRIKTPHTIRFYQSQSLAESFRKSPTEAGSKGAANDELHNMQAELQTHEICLEAAETGNESSSSNSGGEMVDEKRNHEYRVSSTDGNENITAQEHQLPARAQHLVGKEVTDEDGYVGHDYQVEIPGGDMKYMTVQILKKLNTDKVHK